MTNSKQNKYEGLGSPKNTEMSDKTAVRLNTKCSIGIAKGLVSHYKILHSKKGI